MSGPRYTRQQLFALRNHIPITRVIEALAIPCSTHEGHYRFSCPVCNGFNTGIFQKKNLARCFNCEKNYNTIDLVMQVKSGGFIESAAYLEKIQANMPTEINRTERPIRRSGRSEKAVNPNELIHISDIFKSLIPHSPDKASLAQFQKNKNQAISDLQRRVSELERSVKSLIEKITLIEYR
jgi:DNA primase